MTTLASNEWQAGCLGWNHDRIALLDEAMQAVAMRHGLTCARRAWGETVSLELLEGRERFFRCRSPRATVISMRRSRPPGLRSASRRSECWQLYEQKNAGQTARDAAAKVLHSLERLETQRPLPGIADDQQREEAATVRRWYREVFCPQRS